MRFLILALLSCFALQLNAQCGEPSMSIWDNTWTSCDISPNPNPNRDASHWIQYDLGEIYTLSKTHIWNTNASGQSNNGFRNVTVDYSTDGVEWTELGAFEFPQAPETPVYGGFPGFDFAGQTARYVLITATSNWGGDCFGLAEVKFNLSFVVKPCDDPPCGEFCPPPEDVFVAEMEEDFIELEWEPVESADGYLVILLWGDEIEEVEVDDPSIFLDELAANTLYEVEILTLCGENESEATFFSFTTGTTRTVEPEEDSAIDFMLFPNPAREQVNIVFNSELNTKADIQLSTAYGTLVQSQDIQIIFGTNNFTFVTSGLASGVYFVTLLTEDNRSMTKKLMVLK